MWQTIFTWLIQSTFITLITVWYSVKLMTCSKCFHWLMQLGNSSAYISQVTLLPSFTEYHDRQHNGDDHRKWGQGLRLTLSTTELAPFPTMQLSSSWDSRHALSCCRRRDWIWCARFWGDLPSKQSIKQMIVRMSLKYTLFLIH